MRETVSVCHDIHRCRGHLGSVHRSEAWKVGNREYTVLWSSQRDNNGYLCAPTSGTSFFKLFLILKDGSQKHPCWMQYEFTIAAGNGCNKKGPG